MGGLLEDTRAWAVLTEGQEPWDQSVLLTKALPNCREVT